MNYLPKILDFKCPCLLMSVFFSLLACQSVPLEKAPVKSIDLAQEEEGAKLVIYPRDLKALESLEIEDPLNPTIKLLLGLHYYCVSMRAMAFENWIWVQRFSPDGALKSRASQYLRAPDVGKLVDCQKLPVQ